MSDQSCGPGHGRYLRTSAASRLDRPVAGAPRAVGVDGAAAIGGSQQQTLAGFKALADAGVFGQLSAGTYDGQFAATELFDRLAAYEQRVVGRAR